MGAAASSGMNDRARAFRKEIAAALLIGVPRTRVAEVVASLHGEPDLDPTELRIALLQHAPAGAFHAGGDATTSVPIAAGLVSPAENDDGPTLERRAA